MSVMLGEVSHDTVEMTSKMSQQQVHRLFSVSVLIKGVDGVLETIGGILFIVCQPERAQ